MTPMAAKLRCRAAPIASMPLWLLLLVTMVAAATSLVDASGSVRAQDPPGAGPDIAQGAQAGPVTPTRGAQVQLRELPPPPPVDPDSELPPNSGTGRRAVYSKSLQRVWAVDADGTILLNTRVSGRLDPRYPAPGVYSVYSKALHTFAVQNPSITWDYMTRFANGPTGGNIGFHAIPYQYGRPMQTVEQLGQPLSGGCVRMAPADAIWMWGWAGIGTVVVVLA
jgi:lipoprotein-anchoring transpeptidase ErfK/SrfK